MVWRNPTPKLDRNQPALLAAAPLWTGPGQHEDQTPFPYFHGLEGSASGRKASE